MMINLRNALAGLSGIFVTVFALADVLPVDGSKIAPYRLTWHQCSLQDGEWRSQPDLSESLDVLGGGDVGDRFVAHRQLTQRPDGVQITSTTYFRRKNFHPVRMETKVLGANGLPMVSVERVLDEEGYVGVSMQGKEVANLSGAITSQMLHGGALGLPLATIDYQQEPIRFAASMMSFDATYLVTATWVGKENLSFDGQEIEAWLVDVEWLHEGQGDIYAPGPDASGGRYWIVADPPMGFPYVARYKTDTYAVEFLPQTCALP